MVILLSDALIDQGPEQELYYDFVQTIMIAYKEGKHIVIISPTNVAVMIRDERIDATSKIYLRYYQAHEKAVMAYLNIFNIIIEIIPLTQPESFRSTMSDKAEYRAIHFSKLTDTASIQKTIMLGENGNDTVVYGRIAEYYRTRKNLKPFKLSYKEQTGGGSTLHDEYKKIHEKGQEFCLCIVDSDRNAPDSDLGSTAKRVKKFHDDVTAELPNSKCHCHVLDCLELENLFPAQFYKKQYDAKEYDETHRRLFALDRNGDEALLYHDYKKGLKRFADQKNHTVIGYWHPIVLGSCLPLIEYNDALWYLTGFGDSILSNFIKYNEVEAFAHIDKCSRLQPLWIDLGKTVSSFILGTHRKVTV